MEKELIFYILGIKETKDESAIKSAYMILLKQTNPEDDPEGFKRLREAYEAAVAYARTTEAEDEKREKTEVELWLERVEEVYGNMDLRGRKGEWKELLSDPVCEALDTAVEAREQMLGFLTDHIYLPHDIWLLLDKTFHIVDGIDELKERFPANFLNYIKYYVENDSFIRYDLFQIQVPEKQNGDKYLEHYFAVKKKLDQDFLPNAGEGDFPHETQGCLKELSDLKAFGLYYPYEDVERIRLYLKTEQHEKAAELGNELLSRYSDDNYIKVWAGEAFWQIGEEERAYELWQEILKEFPLYYQAKMGSARYLMKRGDYYQAREWLQEILDGNSQDKDAMDQLTECNSHLIEEYTDKLERGETDNHLSDRDMRIELGWCLFQNERIEDAIRSIQDFQPDDESVYDFNNLYGRLLYHNNQYEKSRPYLETWLRLIEETVDDGTEKMRKRISRKCRAMNILGSCLHELGEEEAAEDYLRRAIAVTEAPVERLGTTNYLAHILLQLKQYEKAVDLCDGIIEEDAGYYPAYLIRQEACYELKKGQTVVDDYHQAVAIYPCYYKPYLLAAEVFFFFGQYEDGKGVFDRARENDVEFSDRMKLYEVKILRNLAKSEEERKEPMRLIRELAQTVGEETDLEDRSEIEFEISLLEWDNNQFEPALSHLQTAIRQNPERLQYRMIRGHIYLDTKQYEEALKEYGAAAPGYDEEPSLYYNRGLCYEAQDMKILAAENFEKTLEIRDTYRDACEKVMNYYKKAYETNCRPKDLEKAIDYISRELAERQESYYLIERGRLYLNSYQLDAAIRDFEKALEDKTDDWAGNNNLGCCYKYLGQYDKAIEYFKKAAECMKDRPTVLPYSNMADCYEILEQYEEAIQCYKEDLKLFPDRISFWEDIGDLYFNLGEFAQAKDAYDHMKTEDSYYLCMANIYEKRGQQKRALWYYMRGIQTATAKNRARRWCDLADFASICIPSLAVTAYKKAIYFCDDLDDKFWHEQKLSTHYYRMKKFDEANQYAKQALSHFKQTGKKEADYLSYSSYAPARLRIMALIYMGLGEKETCEAYFEQMDQVLRCWSCRREGCYEKYYYRGIYREANGDLTGAMKDYEKTKELNPVGFCADRLINMLRKKMEVKK